VATNPLVPVQELRQRHQSSLETYLKQAQLQKKLVLWQNSTNQEVEKEQPAVTLGQVGGEPLQWGPELWAEQ
jgi:hypothetical protein